MPPDPAALAEAVATVRKGPPTSPNAPIDLGWEGRIQAWLAATELLARHFLSLLDAGELVRKVNCTAVGWHHGDPCSGGRVQSPNAQFTRDCPACRGTGYVLEPLMPEVRT